jgi:hypothetical protein
MYESAAKALSVGAMLMDLLEKGIIFARCSAQIC